MPEMESVEIASDRADLASPAHRDQDRLDIGREPAPVELDALFKARHVVVLIVEPETGRIVDANAGAVAFYGYSRAELMSLNVRQINTRPAAEIEEALGRARNTPATVFSFQHRLASGEIRDVEVSTGPVIVHGRELFVSIVQDVTVRNEAAERDERIQRLYAAMAEIDHLIGRIDNADTLFREACRISVEVGGFRMAWIGRLDEASPDLAIRIVASFGDRGAILPDIRVAARADLPEGRGATGRALRERRTVVVGDLLADEGMRYWVERLRRQGYRSLAALPLLVPGYPPHVVAVSSDLVGAFGAAEIRLLERMVDDVAFRLQMLDAERARQVAEENLRRSEERYRALVEQAPDGIYVLDRTGHFVDATTTTCEMLGLTADELLTLSIQALAVGESRARIDAGLERLRNEGSHRRTVRYRRPDGREIDIEIHSKLLADGRIQGVLRDVTAARAAEAERDRLAAAVEQAAESIAIVDLDGRIQYVNPALEAMSGYRRDEIVGRPVTMLRTGLLDPDEYDEIDSTASRGTAWSGRVPNRRKDGETYEIDLTCSPIRDRHGEVVGVVEVGRDTRQERALEAQLGEAQRLEAVGRLAGGVAHDFNNLLTAISGYAQLALGDLGDESAMREDVEEILRASGRASALTRQLLAFSRRQLLQPRVVELGPVIGEIVPMLRRLIAEDVRLEFTATPGLRVVADTAQLEQVVMNLVVNARDAMPSGGTLRIEIDGVVVDAADLAAEAGLTPGPYVRLSVADTGVGIAADVIEHVFEPFFTTKERGKGTGLGLAMVFGVARQSNGFVRVDSKPGEGTVFSVFLPAVTAEPETQQPDEPVGANATGSETILVVEDEALVRTFARRVLEERGYRVLEAGSGEEALDVAAREANEIDLLFTDVVMPSMGGRELAARLLAIKPGLQILYASGYPEDALGDVVGGEIAYLEKPYTTEALVARIQSILVKAAASP